jgi:hypothetical protein
MGAARSMRRKAARTRAGRDRRASAATPSLFSPVTAELMAAIEPLLEDADPAPSELLVSHVLGIGARSARGLGMLIGCDAEQVVVDGIVDDLARVASPPAHAALLALGAVASGPTARRALAAARRQRLRGIAEPAWAPALETPPVLVRAIRATDLYGDVDGLALTFARPGLEEWHVAVLVDHGLGGLVKDAFALDAAGLGAWLESMSGLDITEVDVTELARVVIRGMELADAYPAGPPIDDDYWATRALLAAWIGALPGVDTSPAKSLTIEARGTLVDAFLTSLPGHSLADDADGDTGFIVSTIIDHGADHGCGDPLRMSPRVVESYLCDWFPRKVTADKATIRRVPAVLEAWVRFAGDHRSLPSHLVDETVAMIHVLADEFLSRTEDPQAFGMAKRITTAMLDEGVDISDPNAVERWIAGFNRRDEVTRRAIVG